MAVEVEMWIGLDDHCLRLHSVHTTRGRASHCVSARRRSALMFHSLCAPKAQTRSGRRMTRRSRNSLSSRGSSKREATLESGLHSSGRKTPSAPERTSEEKSDYFQPMRNGRTYPALSYAHATRDFDIACTLFR